MEPRGIEPRSSACKADALPVKRRPLWSVGRARVERASAAYKATALSLELPALRSSRKDLNLHFPVISRASWPLDDRRAGWSDGLEPTCTRLTFWALDHFGIDQHSRSGSDTSLDGFALVSRTGIEPFGRPTSAARP